MLTLMLLFDIVRSVSYCSSWDGIKATLPKERPCVLWLADYLYHRYACVREQNKQMLWIVRWSFSLGDGVLV